MSLEREVATAEGSPTLSRYLGSVSATNLSTFLLISEGFMTTQLPAGQELPPGKDLAFGEQKPAPSTAPPPSPQGGHGKSPPSEALVPASTAGTQPSLTRSDGPDEGHQEEVYGVVPGPDDEHHPIGLLADEGRVQLCHLQREGWREGHLPPIPRVPSRPLPRTQFFSTCSSFIQVPRLLSVWLSSLLQMEISETSVSKGGWGHTGGQRGHRCGHSPTATLLWLSLQRSAQSPGRRPSLLGQTHPHTLGHPVASQWQGWVAQPPLQRATRIMARCLAPRHPMPAGRHGRRTWLKMWIWYLKSFSSTRHRSGGGNKSPQLLSAKASPEPIHPISAQPEGVAVSPPPRDIPG